MTNKELFERKLSESGYKKQYIAEKIGITIQALNLKLCNKSDFRAPEIAIIRKLLNLSDAEVNAIFFAIRVDGM